MTPRLAVAALLLAAAAIGAGCGDDGTKGPGGRPVAVWADPALRDALPARVAGVPLRPELASSERLTDRLARGTRPGVLLLEAETFPAWDPAQDRLTGSRVLARDRLVLVGRAPRTPPARVGADRGGAAEVVLPRSGVAGRLARALVAAARRRGAAPKELVVDDSAGVLQAVRDNPGSTGLALRSAVRRAADARRFRTSDLVGGGLVDVFVQAAAGTAEGRPVLRSLAGPDVRRRFARLGLDGPGPNPTVADCTDACPG